MPSPKTLLIVAMAILAAGFVASAAAQQQAPAVGLAAQTDTGTRPYIPYDGAAENINLTNGNLNLKVPLVHLPGRDGFDLDLNLEYDSKFWKLEATYEAETNVLGGAWEEETRAPYFAMGWHLNVPTINYTSQPLFDSIGNQYGCLGTTTVFLSDGARLNFSNNPNCGAPYQVDVIDSEDNSGARLTVSPDNALLALRNGTKIYFSSSLTGTATKMVDANGNTITFAAAPGGGINITDTVGRIVSLTYASGVPSSITYPDSNAPNGTFTVSFGYTNQTVNWSFVIPYTNWNAQPPVFVGGRTGSSNRDMLTSVNLGGRVFSFEYALAGNGELNKITYPSGGYTSYAYGRNTHTELLIATYQANPSYYVLNADFREVTSKQACPTPTTCATTTYSATTAGANNSSIEVVFPDGHKDVHSFTQEMIAGQGGETYHGLAAHETQVVTYSPSGVVMQIVATTYSGTKTWDLPISVSTQLDASGPAKLQTLSYDTFTANYLPWLDPWVEGQPTPTTVTRKIDNIAQRLEYDWGSTTLLRQTVNSWLHTNPANGQDYYSSAIHNLNLPDTSSVYDGAGALKAQTKYVYDGVALTATSGAPGHDYTNYGSGYVTRGNATQVKRWLNTNGTWLITNNAYDDLGNLRSSTDPGGHATTYSWSDSWSGSSCLPASNSYAYLTQVTNALSQRVQASYFPCTGRIQSRKDENDILASRSGTTYTYDQYSRMLTRTTSDGGRVTNSFDDIPPVTVTTTTRMTSSMDLASTAVVDGLGRLSQTQLTTDPEGTVLTDTTYDGLSRTATTSNPYRSTGEATYGVTTYTYDGLSRVTKVIPPDGTDTTNNVTTSYTGNCTTVTDQAGKTRKSCVDGLGRLTQVFEPNASGSFIYETDYQYDPLDNLTRVDQKGNDPNSANWRTRTFTYDSLSRLTQASNPESGAITYTYDADSNLLTRVAPKPNQTGALTVTTTYSYDTLHRLGGRTYSNGDTAVSYYYDQTLYNGLTITNGSGRRTTMVDASGTTSWSYDSEGRVLVERRRISGITKNISYTYNLDGSLASLTYPTGRMVTYGYNAAARPLSAIDTAHSLNYATVATYAPQGALAGMKYGVTGSFTGIVTSNTYNKRLQPIVLSATAPSQTVLSFSYGFGLGTNDNGNVLTIQNNRDLNRSQSFSYDQLNRIAFAWSTGALWGNKFTIDIWGNLTKKDACQTGDPCAGKPLGEYLNQTADAKNRFVGMTYDSAGNLINDGTGNTYTYDAENRISTTAGVTYTYDGDGERVKKSSGTLYWGLASNEPLAESDFAANFTKEFIFFGGKRIARLDLSSGAVHYYFSDHLGSSNVVTNSTGSTIEEESDFYPFGGERTITNLLPDQNYKFTGKERDPESNLDYFGARYYSSNLARFITPDWAAAPTAVPYADFGDPQSLNLYGYVRNNPLSHADPDGHDGWDYALGLLYAWASDNLGGALRAEPYNEDNAAGQAAGDKIALVQGVKEAEAGLAGEAGGGALALSGVGTPEGAVVLGVSAGAVLHGAATSLTAASHLSKNSNPKGDSSPYKKTQENKEKMEAGKAPTGKDGHPTELHHDQKNPTAPAKEMTRTDHRLGPNFKKNHPNTGQEPSNVDRSHAARNRRQHWKKRANE